MFLKYASGKFSAHNIMVSCKKNRNNTQCLKELSDE